MAGDWLKMRRSLWTDGRVIALSRVLSERNAAVTLASRCIVIGALFRLWTLADEHTTDGILKGYTKDDLDAEVGIPGFAEALCGDGIGWLTCGDGFLQVPKFEEHNDASAKRRALAKERAKAFRDRNATVTLASRSQRNDSVTREEKRRDDDSSLTARARGGDQPEPEPEPTLPTSGPGRVHWRLTHAPFCLGDHKARRVLELGTTSEDLDAWLDFENERGTAAMVSCVQRYKHPSEVPEAKAGKSRAPGLDRRSSFAKEGKFDDPKYQ